MKCRYILCDLDGTLLTSDNRLLDTTLATIDEAKKKGAKFVVCTGRSTSFCMSHLKKLSVLGNKDEIVLSSTGTLIVNGLLEPLHVRYLSLENLEMIIDYSAANNVYTSFSSIKNNYIVTGSDHRPPLENSVYEIYKTVSGETMKDIIKKEGIVKTMTFFYEKDGWDKMIKELTPKMSDYEITSTTPHALEFNAYQKISDKGLTKYCELLGIDKSEVLAIGDTVTDKKLLEGAGVAACPSNAKEDLKAIADYVSPYDCNHGAVDDIIRRFILEE